MKASLLASLVFFAVAATSFGQESLNPWKFDKNDRYTNVFIDQAVTHQDRPYTLSASVILAPDGRCLGVSFSLDKIFVPTSGVFFQLADSVQRDGNWHIEMASVPMVTYDQLVDRGDYYQMGFRGGMATAKGQPVNLFEEMTKHRFLFLVLVMDDGTRRSVGVPLGDLAAAIERSRE